MKNELCALASAIEAENAPLPPCLDRLIQNAPESFDDLRAGQIAATVRAMRHAGEPISFPIIGEKHLPFLTFIGAELSPAALPLASAEFYASQCWEAYQVRRAKCIGAELVQGLNSSPRRAQTIIAAARHALDTITSESANGLPDLIDAAEFLAVPIEPPDELVAGILHKGSKLAFGGSSKSFKTWSLLDLAISVSAGADWLGRETAQGKVLFVNFEIQPHSWQKRIAVVAQAKGVEVKAGQIILWNLRGHAADFKKLIPRIIERARRENFALIVLDPIYKLYAGNTDENSAGDVAALLNSLEVLAVETGAAIAFGAHFAKGNAAGKDALDRISGSSVFARDPDSLLIFTKHEEDKSFTVETILRNFAPVPPFVVRWDCPLMRRDDNLDPAKLKTSGGRPVKHRPQDLLGLLPPEGLGNAAWIAAAEEKGISHGTFYTLRRQLKESGKVLESVVSGKWQPIQPKETPCVQ